MAIIRGVKLSDSAIQQKIKLEVMKQASGKGDNGAIKRDADKAIESLANQIVGFGGAVKGVYTPQVNIREALRDEVITDITTGLGMIQDHLASGFEGADKPQSEYGWHPLTPAWRSRKQFASKNLYWRNTGKLDTDFQIFVAKYLTQLAAAPALVKSRARQNVYGKRKFSYEIDINVPRSGELVFDQYILNSFIRAEGVQGRFKSTSGRSGVGKLGYLEGLPGLIGKEPNTYRPFMADLMAARGLSFLQRSQGLITDVVNKLPRIKGGGRLKL